MGIVNRRISIPSIQVSLTLTLESGSSASGASRACALQKFHSQYLVRSRLAPSCLWNPEAELADNSYYIEQSYPPRGSNGHAHSVSLEQKNAPFSIDGMNGYLIT